MPSSHAGLPSEDDRAAFAEALVMEGAAKGAALETTVSLAARLFDVPMAAVTIIGANRLWAETAVGVEVREMPRDETFCTHAIAAAGLTIVPDATLDARFRDLPAVLKGEVRFYAGAPLRTANGLPFGAFCIVDTKPRRRLSKTETRVLADFASIALLEIESRRTARCNNILKGLSDSVGASLICTDETGRIAYANPAAERLLGYTPEELVGRNVVEIIPQRFVAVHRAGMARVAAGAPSKLAGKTFETLVRRKDGGEVPVDLGLSVWRDEDGLKFGSTMRDISERKQKEERLKRLAHDDALTGLPGANALRDTLAHILEERHAATVLLIEIEGLRSVNDGIGHRIGDALLKAIAIRLVGAVPDGARLARWSGVVFAAILPGPQDSIGIAECAQDVALRLAEPFEIDGHVVVVGATIGAARAPAHARTTPELIAAADLALHRAKSDQGQRFRLFEQAMETQSAARRALRDEVRHALDESQFVLFYQPQVSLETHAVVGAEALMRWRHPERGLLLPGTFIPAMDHSALALQAGWWSLDQACRQIAAWRAEKRPPLRVSVNLFAAQLRYGGLATTVRDLIHAYDIGPGQLELEVRETIANQDEEAVIRILCALRDLGVGIALDDFGTGYASLRTLKRLPVTTIKIDQSFVRGMGDDVDRHDRAIVEAILGVGRGLGLDVVAEGIETPAQAATLRRMGCPSGQGFLFGRPVPGGLFSGRPALALGDLLPAVDNLSPRKLSPRRR